VVETNQDTFSWSSFRLAQAESGASQNTSASSAAAQSSPPSLEEVIVTAQKIGEQRLKDVPIPISVVDTDKLVASGQTRLVDFYSTVPGLDVSPTGSGFQRLTIRGVASIAGGNASTPTVGITVDDSPFGGSTRNGGGGVVPDIDPGDLARIEVLRG